ncbi:efflux RND transporter permease subunit [Agitococcus lubricus]|uniref:Multidrug efflux pump n=1 Tax=Agitococcus lubricus TaxID=1077255 RepID=A0A2T5J137_9GAMM|nr:efflux RND transporter permease subunit [Agitococcus lubricus]PTQ90083.1 multidrug efflux pump [Agitococcus lubricus]
MQLPALCIKRPVLAIVMNLLIVLAGLLAFDRLTVREYPNIDIPTVTVDTTYSGASAAIVESTVTKILEDSLSGIEGIDYLSSISRTGRSQITIAFKQGREIDSATSDVRDRVSRVRGKLPDTIDEPVITKTEADAQPIIWLAFSSTRHNPLQINQFADKQVKSRLQTLDGVADIRIFGERRPAMRIWLDSEKLSRFSLTPQDVEATLRAQNVEIPSGRVESLQREFSVLAETDVNTPEQFGQLIIRQEAGLLVRVADVARVEIAPEDVRRIARFNGTPAVALGVIKTSTANPLEVSKAVRAELPKIEESLPEGMQVRLAYDSSVFIQESIDSVQRTILEAVALVILVIFIFLRSLRATLIPVITIPVSLIGALIFMQIFGFSINTLTLLAMVLAIGLVVDDAIVVLENIYRHIEEGKTPVQAAIQGSKEIAFAVLAMTFTLAAVFAPIAFTEGRTGKLFAEFALTLAAAVIVSGFCALTLSPMMSSRLLTAHQPDSNVIYRAIERGLNAMTAAYEWLLTRLLVWRWLVLSLSLVAIGAMVVMFKALPSELSPIEDRGVIVSIGIGPEGATPQYFDKYAQQVEQIYSQVPERASTFLIIGFPDETKFISFNRFIPWAERERTTAMIVPNLMPQLSQVPGVMALATLPPSLGQGTSSSPIEFVLQTTGSYADLGKMIGQLMEKLAQNPNIVNPIPDLKLNKPQLSLAVDRDKAALLDVGVADIGKTLETLLGSRKVTTFKLDGDQYDVMLQLEDDGRRTPDQLQQIYVRNSQGQILPLSALITMQETVSPAELNHFNKLRSAKITASLAEGYAMGDAVAYMQQAMVDINNPTMSYDWAGQTREFLTSGDALAKAFILAVLFIYLVLAAQFESFRDPFIILFSVPLAMLGAIWALKLTGGTLNVYSQIGLITLVGLISKHGILLVEFANQLQEQGRTKIQAVVESASLRLRPILMTTAAMVLGAVPLAIAVGAGAEVRHPIGWVIVGGMTIGTLFTLFVIPCLYLVIGRVHSEHDNKNL